MPGTPEPLEHAAHGGLAAARERGQAQLRTWAKDGTLLSAEAFAAARGISTADLVRAEARHDVFSLFVEGQHCYPAEFLKLDSDDAAALCQALAEEDAASKLIFVLRKHGGLAGRTIAEAIGAGRLERVLDLARDWAARS